MGSGTKTSSDFREKHLFLHFFRLYLCLSDVLASGGTLKSGFPALRYHVRSLLSSRSVVRCTSVDPHLPVSGQCFVLFLMCDVNSCVETSVSHWDLHVPGAWFELQMLQESYATISVSGIEICTMGPSRQARTERSFGNTFTSLSGRNASSRSAVRYFLVIFRPVYFSSTWFSKPHPPFYFNCLLVGLNDLDALCKLEFGGLQSSARGNALTCFVSVWPCFQLRYIHTNRLNIGCRPLGWYGDGYDWRRTSWHCFHL